MFPKKLIQSLSSLSLQFEKIISDLHKPKQTPWQLVLRQAIFANQWFTPESIIKSLHGIQHMLQPEKIENWLNKYSSLNWNQDKRIGIIMAGNIPMVGFHDLLCVLVSGNIAVVKLSQQDTILMKAVIDELMIANPEWKNKIEIVERLNKIDKVIATGSNNSSGYFNYYFSKYPHIIRKNRNGIAVLNGNETKDDLQKLGDDIFTYFGLGCRNVTKVYVPRDYIFDNLFEALLPYADFANHNKFINNYDYHRAILLLNNDLFLTNNFLIIREGKSFASPVSVLNFEYYEDVNDLAIELHLQREKIQCIVSNEKIFNSIPFGTTQQPAIDDYADGVDTMAFLLR
jgi:hypothetical protein